MIKILNVVSIFLAFLIGIPLIPFYVVGFMLAKLVNMAINDKPKCTLCDREYSAEFGVLGICLDCVIEKQITGISVGEHEELIDIMNVANQAMQEEIQRSIVTDNGMEITENAWTSFMSDDPEISHGGSLTFIEDADGQFFVVPGTDIPDDPYSWMPIGRDY